MKRLLIAAVMMLLTSTVCLADSKMLNLSKVLETTSIRKIIAQNKNLRDLSKFVFTKDKELIVSRTGEKRPKHYTLASHADEVLSAGYISLNKGDKGVEVHLNNKSNSYCPSFESLNLVKAFLIEKLGKDTQVTLVKKPGSDC